MKVTTVSANIRYSRDTRAGAWKVVELGAEATIDGKEGWKDAQASLYRDLSRQLKALWASANGHKAAQEAPEKPAEAPLEPTQTPPPPPEHYCQQHQTEYKRYEKDGRVWYSHRLANGKWCREK